MKNPNRMAPDLERGPWLHHSMASWYNKRQTDRQRDADTETETEVIWQERMLETREDPGFLL